MAEASHGVPHDAISVRRRVAKIVRTRPSHALVATRTNGKCSTGFVTHKPSLQIRIATLPHSPLAPPSLASHPECPRLPVWPLDALGHHRGAWATAGVVGRSGWALESVTSRVCRETRARVWTNVFVRDIDLASFDNLDGRRLEVVADGFPFHGGAQLAIDTTMVSPLHCCQERSIGQERAHSGGRAQTQSRTCKRRRWGKVGSIPKLHSACPPWLGPRLENSHMSCWETLHGHGPSV